jgi:hypothetical protein
MMKRDDFLFTKGPWTWQRGEKWHRLHGVGPDRKPVTVLRAAQNNGQMMTPMTVADQHLIEAAPEMLYAIDEALRLFPTGCMSPPEFSAFEELRRVHLMARTGQRELTT